MKMGIDTGIREPREKIAADHAGELMAHAEDMDLRRLFATVWRSKWPILILAMIGLGLSYLHLRNVPPAYSAVTLVLWEARAANVIDIAPVERGGLGGDMFLRQSQLEILISDRLLGKVVDDLMASQDPDAEPAIQTKSGWLAYVSPAAIKAGLNQVLILLGIKEEPEDKPARAPTPDRDRLIGIVRSMIDAKWRGQSYVLEIVATTWSAEVSQKLANRLAHHYSLDQVEKKYEATRLATEWLSSRVTDLGLELEKAEEAVKAFKAGSTLVSAQALDVDDRRIKELRQRSLELGRRRDDAVAEIDALKGFVNGDFDISRASSLKDSRLRQLAEAVVSAQVEGSDQLDVLTDRFGAEAAGVLQERTAELGRIDEQMSVLNTTVASLEEEVRVKSEALVKLNQLEREAAATRQLYDSFLARLKETTIQVGSHEPDARVLNPARKPGGPSWPNRPATMALGFTGGLFIGIIFVVLRERLNITFRTADDLEARTGFPVLGSLPVAPFSRRSSLTKFLIKRPASSFGESVRNLRTSILLSSLDTTPQVIMVTSGLPGEGKTTSCIALAQISRSLGKKVIVIECDLRRRNFRTYFKMPGKDGVLSVLGGQKPFDEVVHVDPNTGLHVLAGEESAVNAADVFASKRFGEFIRELREHYDFVFIDTPPVLAVPDSRVIAQHADSVVYLVRWNKTLRDSVAQGLRVFQQVNIRVAGLVLSQIDMREMARYGYKAYGYYYRQTARYYKQ